MSLPLLITLAVLTPLLLLLAFLAFAKGTAWLGQRPKTFAVLFISFGIAYIAAALWEARDGFRLSDSLPLALGVSFCVSGVLHWRRGVPADFE